MKARTSKTAKHKYYFTISKDYFNYLNENFHLFVWGDIYIQEETYGYKVFFKNKTKMLNKKFDCANFLFAQKNDGFLTNIN